MTLFLDTVRWIWQERWRTKVRSISVANLGTKRIVVNLQPRDPKGYRIEAKYNLSGGGADRSPLGLDLGSSPYLFREFFSDVHDTGAIHGVVYRMDLRDGVLWDDGVVIVPFDWIPNENAPFLRAPNELPSLLSRWTVESMEGTALPRIVVVVDELISELQTSGIRDRDKSAWLQSITYDERWLTNTTADCLVSTPFAQGLSKEAGKEIGKALDQVIPFIGAVMSPPAQEPIIICSKAETPPFYHHQPGLPIIVDTPALSPTTLWRMDFEIALVRGLVSCYWGGGCKLIGPYSRELEAAVAGAIGLWWSNIVHPSDRGKEYLRSYHRASALSLARNARAALEGSTRPKVVARATLALYARMRQDPATLDRMAMLLREYWGRFLSTERLRTTIGVDKLDHM